MRILTQDNAWPSAGVTATENFLKDRKDDVPVEKYNETAVAIQKIFQNRGMEGYVFIPSNLIHLS